MVKDLAVCLNDARGALIEAEFYLNFKGDTPLSDRLRAICQRFDSLVLLAETAGHDDLAVRIRSLQAHCLKAAEKSPPVDGIEILIKDFFQTLRFALYCVEVKHLSPNELLDGFFAFFLSTFDVMLARFVTCLNSGADPSIRDSLRVLIADDEEVVRIFLQDLLENAGHLVLAVENGMDGIEALSTGFFDVMFTDINMPRANGIEVLKKAREIAAEIEIIVITGYASLENATEAVRYGAYDYLVKPFHETADVLTSLRRAASHLQLKRRNRDLVFDLQRKNEELTRYNHGLEEALSAVREKNNALVHADRMVTLGVLAAGVAHEINNPTTFIRGNLQTMRKFWDVLEQPLAKLTQSSDNPKLPFVIEEMPALLRDMIVGTDRIIKITSGLRSYAYHNVDDDDSAQQVDVAECAQQAIALTANTLKNRVDLVEKIDAVKPLSGNAQEITQVLVNLILNAADVLDERRDGLITLSVHDVEHGVEFSVTDNGRGIPVDIRDKIFVPFFTTKGVSQGTGLGLSIVLGIIRSHGGYISVLPGDGSGTCFQVFLPFSAEESESSKPRILFTGADSPTNHPVEHGLQTSGMFDFHVARCAEAAMTCIQEEPLPDLLMVDMMLNGLDGLELIHRFRTDEKTKSIPILVLTNVAATEMIDRLKGFGVAHILITPVRVSELMSTIMQLIHNRYSLVRFESPSQS